MVVVAAVVLDVAAAPATVVEVFGFVVVVVVAVFVSGGRIASTGRKRSSAVLPTSRRALSRSRTPGRSMITFDALPADLGLGDTERVDPAADDVDGLVERRLVLHLADRREHDGDPALQVQAEHRPVVREQRGHERADDEHHERHGQVPEVAPHQSSSPARSRSTDCECGSAGSLVRPEVGRVAVGRQVDPAGHGGRAAHGLTGQRQHDAGRDLDVELVSDISRIVP